MSEYNKEFKTGETKKIKYGSKQADTIRKAAKKNDMKANNYVKQAALTQAQICK